jgi:Fic-DOC domain mobile mystery protein B
MTPFEGQPDGATPLTAEDVEGLKPPWVSTQAELNQAEAENILRGRLWASRARRPPFWYLRDAGPKDLHQRMFGDVWAWAGQLRQRETNIGLDPHQIPVAVRDLCEDTAAQIGSGSKLAYPADELAVRFHHRLVLIHPFRNGNGRHARLATDLLVADLGRRTVHLGRRRTHRPHRPAYRLPHGPAPRRHHCRLHGIDRVRATHQLITRSNPGPSDDELTLLRSSICTCALPTTGTTSGEQLLCQQLLYFAAVLRPHASQRPSSRIGRGPLTCGLIGGAEGTRTPDPLVANEVRYQLRHSPVVRTKR